MASLNLVFTLDILRILGKTPLEKELLHKMHNDSKTKSKSFSIEWHFIKHYMAISVDSSAQFTFMNY